MLLRVLERRGDDPDDGEPDPCSLQRRRPLPAREPVDERDDRRRRGDRSDDAHRPDCECAVERGDSDDAHGAGERRPGGLLSRRRRFACRRDHRTGDRDPRDLREHRDDEEREPARAHARGKVGEAPCEARREGEKDAHSATGLVAATASSWFA